MAIWAIAAFAWVASLPAVRGLQVRLPSRAPRPALPALSGRHPVRPTLRRRGGAVPILGPDRVILLLSVPASIALGMLIAHVLH